MTLHQVFSPQAFLKQELQALVQANDKVLLLGDALYAVSAMASWHELYVREKDLIERGLEQQAPQGMHRIDDAQWVKLTLDANNTLSWL